MTAICTEAWHCGGADRKPVSASPGHWPLSSAAATAGTFGTIGTIGSAVWRAVSNGCRHAAAAYRSVVSDSARCQHCVVGAGHRQAAAKWRIECNRQIVDQLPCLLVLQQTVQRQPMAGSRRWTPP